MGDFDEASHPRDEKGRFGSGGGSDKPGSGRDLKVWAGRKSEHERMRETIGKLSLAIDSGKLTPGVSLGKHVRIAKETLGKHEAEKAKEEADLQKLAPAGAKVKVRVKELESALRKIAEKPKYGTADKLQDTTGMRVIAKNMADVEKTVGAIREKYKVVSEDNYLKNGKEGGAYRSHHMIIETKAGLQKEIQVRTERQNAHADWAHKVYKPETPEAVAAVEKHGAELDRYSKAVSDHYYAKDTGKTIGRMPKASRNIIEHFGKLPDV